MQGEMSCSNQVRPRGVGFEIEACFLHSLWNTTYVGG